MSTVLRPSVAALSIAAAAAIITMDASPHVVGVNHVDITDLSCNGLFRPVCRAIGG